MDSFKDRFSTGYKDDNGQPGLTPSQTAIVVAILSLGTVIGALVAAPVGDLYGRRLSLIAAVTVFNFGVIFQVCADAIPMLLVGRYVQRAERWQKSRLRLTIVTNMATGFSLVSVSERYRYSSLFTRLKWLRSGYEEPLFASTNFPSPLVFSRRLSST